MDSSFTTILPQNPGYYLRLFPDSTYTLEWSPVPSHYSPPSLHQGIWKQQVPVDKSIEKGLIIGKQGRHLKRITEKSKCLYIFLLQDTIEIWGSYEAVQQAEQELTKHLDYLVRQSIYCPHARNAEICSQCKDCSVCREIAHCYGCNKCSTCHPQPFGYCKGCGGCASCAPIFTQGMCEECFEYDDNYMDRTESQISPCINVKDDDDQLKLFLDMDHLESQIYPFTQVKDSQFDYTEHFRAQHAPALSYDEAELLLQRAPPSSYICCTDRCDESEMCRCCAGVCNH